jgi:hypothetical protein
MKCATDIPSSPPSNVATPIPSSVPTTDPLAGCPQGTIVECKDGEVDGIVMCFSPDETDFEEVCIPVGYVPIAIDGDFAVCGKDGPFCIFCQSTKIAY